MFSLVYYVNLYYIELLEKLFINVTIFLIVSVTCCVTHHRRQYVNLLMYSGRKTKLVFI